MSVAKQGTTVIEATDENGILVMHPDGTIEGARNAKHAARLANRWYQANLPAGAKVGVGEVDWRGVVPPVAKED